MEKFKCIEYGENEVDYEDAMCEACFAYYNDIDDTEEDEE